MCSHARCLLYIQCGCHLTAVGQSVTWLYMLFAACLLQKLAFCALLGVPTNQALTMHLGAQYHRQLSRFKCSACCAVLGSAGGMCISIRQL